MFVEFLYIVLMFIGPLTVTISDFGFNKESDTKVTVLVIIFDFILIKTILVNSVV